MALSFAQLQDLLKKAGYRYFIAPDQPLIRFTVAGRAAQYDIAIFLMDQGAFFQFRTIGYFRCPASHPNFKPMLQTLVTINYQMRYLKLGWDPNSGEITAYGDCWVMDNQVTQEQFRRMLGVFLPGIDASFPRIRAALETGKDPGVPPAQAPPPPPPVLGEPALPPHLRALLDRAQQQAGSDQPAPGREPEIKEI